MSLFIEVFYNIKKKFIQLTCVCWGDGSED